MYRFLEKGKRIPRPLYSQSRYSAELQRDVENNTRRKNEKKSKQLDLSGLSRASLVPRRARHRLGREPAALPLCLSETRRPPFV